MTSERGALNTNDSPSQSSLSSFSHPSRGVDELKLKQAEKILINRVRQTQSAIRRIDLLAAFFAFITLALALLLFGVILDCWIIPNGLSQRCRLYYACFWCISSIAFFIYKLVPVFRRKINALYAAKTLEELWQDDHNFTINWLQLREADSLEQSLTETRKAVIQGVVQQAIENANKQPKELKIDCGSAIRWGIAFTVVVAMVAGYLVFSPKNPFTGAGRIIAPLASIERPQALHFKSIEPGNTIVYQGDFLEITAEIPGAGTDAVELLYSSDDRRIVDMAIPMKSQGLSKFTASLPVEESGFSENLIYRIVVGRGAQIESSSDEFKIEVRPQPTFRVEKTELIFPEYTGLAPQSFENQGDIRALEGTSVVITARCNADLKRAVLFPDGKSTRAREMTVDSQNPRIASITLDLTWTQESLANGDTNAELEQDLNFYNLVSHDVDDQENRNRQDYTVSIVRDNPPQVRWISTPKTLEVPLNDVLHVQISAEDEDFSLRSAEIAFAYRGTENGNNRRNNVIKPLVLSFPNQQKNVDYTHGPTPFVGVIELSAGISPEELGFNVGDEIEYWCVVYDSKLPEPNVATSDKRLLRVVEPVNDPQGINVPQDDEDKQEQHEEKEENSGSGQNGAEEGDSNNSKNNEGDNNESNDEASGEQENEDVESSNSSTESSESGNNSDETDEEDVSGESQDSDQTASQETSNTEGVQTQESRASSEGSKSNESSDDSSMEGNDSSESSSSGSNNSQNNNKGSENGENERGPNDGDSSENQGGDADSLSPSSPNTKNSSNQDAAEAFEKILEHINETGAGQPQDGKKEDKEDNDSVSGQTKMDEQTSGNGSGDSSSKENEYSSDSFPQKEEEIDPDFQSDTNIPKPKEKRDLPTRTSSEKPKEDSPSYQAKNPGKLDENTPRRQDDVDPDSNNFLGQNAPKDVPEDNSFNKSPNSNITLDPQDQSQATAGNSDPNAPEAKGNSNNIPDGPFEIDDDPMDTPSDNNRSNNTIDPNEILGGFPGATGAGGSESDQTDSERTDNNSEPGDSSQERSSNSDKEGMEPSNGISDQNSTSQGGGGGSGLGEIGSDGQTLAPADAPKLQYAEQATNLVLEYLEDSLKDEVDPRLMKKLGWSEEQLREFLERWKKMRQSAQSGNNKSKNAYLKALEELCFEDLPIGSSNVDLDTLEQRQSKNETRPAKSASEVTRLKTPDRLSERVRAFTQGVSQGVNPL